MMQRSNRGAAQYGLIIGAMVFGLVAIAFGAVAYSDKSKFQKDVASAKENESAAKSDYADVVKVRQDISAVLGWYDRNNADPASDPALALQYIQDTLRSTFPDVGDEDKDFETVLPKLIAAYNERNRKVAELETRISSLEGDIAARDQTIGDVTRQKDDTISSLRSELSDEQSNAQQREGELQDRLDTALKQVSERDQELRVARSEAQDQIRALEAQKRIDEARLAELSRLTSFTKEPFASYPDGKVIEVAPSLNLGWIDLGANQRLTRGMRFRVEGGPPGNRRFKGYADVTNVESDRAEVVFSEQVDRFDKIVPGDVLINRLYDPKGGRNAVLVGRFSGRFNEKELEVMLKRIGINVQKSLELTTHFIIVGSELYNDPETNEPLEDPIQPQDLRVYRDAEARGLQIIPLQDIQEFLRIGASGS